MSERDADFRTMSGVPVEPAYGSEDGEWPGQYPYTRGPYASMYRSKLWTMRMFAGFGTADDTNWRLKGILKAGGGGFVAAVGMPHVVGVGFHDGVSGGGEGRFGAGGATFAPMEEH